MKVDVKDFQSNRKLNVGDICGTIGPNWWRVFMRRHEDVIVSRRGGEVCSYPWPVDKEV